MAKRIKNEKKPMATPVRLDVRSDTPSYYVNYMAVSHTPFDLTISVAKVPSPPSPEQVELAKKGQAVPLEAILQLVVPPIVARGLINALTDQLQKYEKTVMAQVKSDEQK